MIRAIFAIDLNGGMGKAGSLPWPHDAEDMGWFRYHTKDQVVVLGSRTWQDPNMPSPLPGRINVVVSDQPADLFAGADHVIPNMHLRDSLDEIELMHPGKGVWIIGGANLLRRARDLVSEAYVTHFHDDYGCDTVLDATDWLLSTTIQAESYGRNKTFRVYTCNHI